MEMMKRLNQCVHDLEEKLKWYYFSLSLPNMFVTNGNEMAHE